MQLTKKVAIVTGGNSGIGKAIVVELAREGANVVVDYISHPDATDELEKQVAALGDRAIGVDADVSKVADLEKLVATAVKAFGRLDIMVNNAGMETRTSVLDTTEQQYEKVLEVNLKSAFFGTQLAARQMIKQKSGGRIINITSVHEDWPMPGNTAYCLSKAACACSRALRPSNSRRIKSWSLALAPERSPLPSISRQCKIQPRWRGSTPPYRWDEWLSLGRSPA